jgi:phytoene dehydrogenase-like protein
MPPGVNTYNDTYDAVIIGAGLGGLVCGCYLAKAGMKVLLAERHFKPGGYCTSFRRNAFTFDAAAHSFGGFRKDGIVRKALTDLGLEQKIPIKRFDPSDTIITPGHKISFWSDAEATISDFEAAFPSEKGGIRAFFSFLLNPDPTLLVRMRKWTVRDLLDHYFNNDRLKAVLAFPLLGNGGLPPSLMSAFAGSKILTEFLLDGGYYPEGGMQALPDMLAAAFKAFGGELLLSSPVKKIEVKEGKIRGIVLDSLAFIPAKCVISNCDARQTFFGLLGKKNVDGGYAAMLNSMIPSLSMFVLYLGIDEHFTSLPKPGTNVWFLPHYDIEEMYLLARKRSPHNMHEYMLRVSPDNRTLLAFVNADYKNRSYWKKNKTLFTESFLRMIEKSCLPGLAGHILYKDAATPDTLSRYTLNSKGAAYGWACTATQLAEPSLRKPFFVDGLYLAGHWTTYGQGIPGVVYSAYDTAKTILRRRIKP